SDCVEYVCELEVGERRAIDPEIADGDAVNRRFLGIMLVGAHAECTAGNPDHVSGLDALRFNQIARHPKARLGFHPRVLAHGLMLRAETIQTSWTVVHCSPREPKREREHGD